MLFAHFTELKADLFELRYHASDTHGLRIDAALDSEQLYEAQKKQRQRVTSTSAGSRHYLAARRRTLSRLLFERR